MALTLETRSECLVVVQTPISKHMQVTECWKKLWKVVKDWRQQDLDVHVGSWSENEWIRAYQAHAFTC